MVLLERKYISEALDASSISVTARFEEDKFNRILLLGPPAVSTEMDRWVIDTTDPGLAVDNNQTTPTAVSTTIVHIVDILA